MNILERMDQPVLGDYVPAAFENYFDEMEPLELSDREIQAIFQLNRLTIEDGNEHAVVLLDGQQHGSFLRGTTNSVPLNVSSLPRDGRIALFHSHSNSAPPSVADLRYFCAENVDRICAVAYNSDIFLVDIGLGDKPDVWEFEDVSRQITSAVDREILFDDCALEWSVDERNYRAMRESFFRICRHFKWTMRGGRL